MRERQRFDARLVLCRGEAAVGHEHRIRRVIMPGVEIGQRGVREFGDDQRIAATVVAVNGVRQQRRVQVLPELRYRRTHRAFHLVVDDAVVVEAGAVSIVRQLHPPAFLGEIERMQARKEHRIEVHAEQVVEVLPILGCERVSSAVGTREGVHIGVQRPPQHHEERVAHWVAAAAAERGVLENVCDAGRILGQGREGDHERVVAVGAGEMIMARPGRRMAVLRKLDTQ